MDVLAGNYTLESACFHLWDFPGKKNGQREGKKKKKIIKGSDFSVLKEMESAMLLIWVVELVPDLSRCPACPPQGRGFVPGQ